LTFSHNYIKKALRPHNDKKERKSTNIHTTKRPAQITSRITNRTRAEHQKLKKFLFQVSFGLDEPELEADAVKSPEPASRGVSFTSATPEMPGGGGFLDKISSILTREPTPPVK